jgi:multiple sugar transport system permease protein
MLNTKRSPVSKLWLYAVLTVGFVAVVAPFAWMILGSFKGEGELRQVPPTWWPQSPSLNNYRDLFSKQSFPRYFVNSTLVAVVVTAGNLVFCSMLGYALAKLSFRGKRLVFGLVMGTLMVPGMVTFVPLFVLVANLGLVDSYPGLILPFLVTPFGVFLMRQFIVTLPDDLLDAGRVDGAGELSIFRRIILPLCGPALATLGILTFLGSWNSFLWPLVVAQTQDHYTLPVALALFSTGQNQTNYGLLLAGATVVVLPILAVFLVFQRRFIEGIATTGIK